MVWSVSQLVLVSLIERQVDKLQGVQVSLLVLIQSWVLRKFVFFSPMLNHLPEVPMILSINDSD